MAGDGISQGYTPQGGAEFCRDTSRRFAIVPEEAWINATLVRAACATTTVRQEAGLAVRQPDLSTPAPAGDLRPTLSGTPEVHVEGTISVNKSGVTETARFGWVRDGDAGADDLQIRQSPHVLGRRPDLIRCMSPTGTLTTRRIVRPKLLPLVSGDLLATWIESDWGPLYGRDAAALTTAVSRQYCSRLDHTTDTWSAVITGPIPDYWSLSTTPIIAGDMIQFPDTGEILMFLVRQDTMITATCDPRRLYVFASTDDGDTWTEKRRLFFDGAPPDILLDSNNDGTSDDPSPFQAIACELLPSGRIVLMAITENMTWSLISDNRGASFTPVYIDAQTTTQKYAGHGVSSTLARNDVALFVASYRDTNSEGDLVLRVTSNGVDWTSANLDFHLSSVDISICVSPDGWPHLYGTAHSFLDPAPSPDEIRYRDWLWGRRFKTRDPLLGDAASDWLNAPVSATPYAFHCHSGNTSSGDYFRDLAEPFVNPPIEFVGFVGIDAVQYRGQVVIAATVQRDFTVSSLDEQPDCYGSSLMIYRANHWQPLQEILSDARNTADIVYPQAGRIYNLTWDCYDFPDNWNWTRVGAGLRTIIVGGAHGGYLRLGDGTGAVSDLVNYVISALPSSTDSQAGVLRAVVYPAVGGSMTADEIAIRFFLNSSTVTMATPVVRFENTGTAFRVGLFNNIGGASFGTADFTINQWIEVLLRVGNDGLGDNKWQVALYARSYPKTTDPDWDEPYTLVGSSDGLSPGAVAGDTLSFGQFVEGDQQSYWKTVQIHRTEETSPSEITLFQRGVTWVDTDSQYDKSVTGTGEAALDSGIENVMRAAIAASEPAQFVTRGLSATWRGEAVTRGQLSHATGYDFDAERPLTLPVVREWRSVDTGDAMELIYDADPTGTTGERFRPDAIAVFGRNFPALSVGMNDTDGPWDAAAPFYYKFGYDNSSLGEDRYTHLWSYRLPATGWAYYIDAKRLTVYPPSGDGPWRQHQFRSQDSGPCYYLAVRNTSTDPPAGPSTFVYRIRDNTEDTLILFTAPTAVDIGVTADGETTFPYPWVIFSSTFACMFPRAYPTTYTPTGSATVYPNSHLRGYRYLRLLLPKVYHKDADEAFYRLGCVMLGKTIDLGSPDVTWGWQSQQGSGHEIATAQDGTTRSVRNHSPRRTLSFDATYLRPPEEVAANYLSPSDAMPVARRSWAHWVDAVRRLEVDGIPCALVWDGDRAYDSMTESELSPVACDPVDVFPARVTSPGTVEHVQWEIKEMMFPVGVVAVPRPAMRVSGVTFTEEF